MRSCLSILRFWLDNLHTVINRNDTSRIHWLHSTYSIHVQYMFIVSPDSVCFYTFVILCSSLSSSLLNYFVSYTIMRPPNETHENLQFSDEGVLISQVIERAAQNHFRLWTTHVPVVYCVLRARQAILKGVDCQDVYSAY